MFSTAISRLLIKRVSICAGGFYHRLPQSAVGFRAYNLIALVIILFL